MSEKSKEEIATNLFERFSKEHVANGDILPDIDLLMEEGIHNTSWESFTREEQLAVREALAIMEKVTQRQRENSIQKTYPELKNVAEDWSGISTSPETIITINNMVTSGRIDPRTNLTTFIEHFGKISYRVQ